MALGLKNIACRTGKGRRSVDVTEQPDPASLSIDRLAGDSAEQRRAERLMLDLLERQLNCRLERPWRRSLPGGGRLEVDGGTDDPNHTLLVEAWVHQGPPKPASRHRRRDEADRDHGWTAWATMAWSAVRP
jgi:hypothetical protein